MIDLLLNAFFPVYILARISFVSPPLSLSSSLVFFLGGPAHTMYVF